MRGGKRTGAGRKPGFAAKNAEEARKYFSERVAEEIGPICDVLVSSAKKGDIRAIKELLDRSWGRPPQAMEVAAKEPLVVHLVDFSTVYSQEKVETVLTDKQHENT